MKAKLSKRFMAFMFDMILFNLIFGSGIYLLCSYFLKENQNTGFLLIGLLFSFAGLGFYVYYLIYMLYKQNQTIGKKIFKIKVIKINSNEELTIYDCILREIIGKFLSAVPFMLGFLWAIFNRERMTFHDKLTKTKVVNSKN